MGTTEYTIILIIFILPIAALFDLMSVDWVTKNKAVWAVIIILMPFVGPVLYLLTTRLRFLFNK